MVKNIVEENVQCNKHNEWIKYITNIFIKESGLIEYLYKIKILQRFFITPLLSKNVKILIGFLLNLL